METGERWNTAKYDEMNQVYQDQTIEQLRDLAGRDEPFFLQYWPLLPLHNTRAGRTGPESPNGGLYADKMQLLDRWIGDILAELETLGIADETVVVVMGDNGHFTKYAPQSGFTPMIFRGGKGDTSEGGIRVDAFIGWPGMPLLAERTPAFSLFTSVFIHDAVLRRPSHRCLLPPGGGSRGRARRALRRSRPRPGRARTP